MDLEVIAMIACIIEFGTKEGRDDDRKRLLTELFVELNQLPGFLSKETFDDVDRPGRRITISYWEEADALRNWMRNAAHIRAIDQGKREIFSHYNIKIATIERETDWTAPAPLTAG
jgi:heme-degrading monooxygenase HmoA